MLVGTVGIQAQLDELYDRHRAAHPAEHFVPCGVVDEAVYLASKPRIVFLLILLVLCSCAVSRVGYVGPGTRARFLGPVKLQWDLPEPEDRPERCVVEVSEDEVFERAVARHEVTGRLEHRLSLPPGIYYWRVTCLVLREGRILSLGWTVHSNMVPYRTFQVLQERPRVVEAPSPTKPAPPAPAPQPPAAPTTRAADSCAPEVDGRPELEPIIEKREAYWAAVARTRQLMDVVAAGLMNPGRPVLKGGLQAKVLPASDIRSDTGPHRVVVTGVVRTPGWSELPAHERVEAALAALEQSAEGLPAGLKARICVDRERRQMQQVDVPVDALAASEWPEPQALRFAVVLEGDAGRVVREFQSSAKPVVSVTTPPNTPCGLHMDLRARGEVRVEQAFDLTDDELARLRRVTLRSLDEPRDRQQRYTVVPRGGAR